MADYIKKQEITLFRLDKKNRKGYIADNHGDVKVYNIASGV